MVKKRLPTILLLAACAALVVLNSSLAQPNVSLAGLILNGDFEGEFYLYGSGQVARHWVPYNLGTYSPQYLRSTLHVFEGDASQMIWADTVPWYSGILQTTALTSGAGGARIQAGTRYVVYVWLYSIYGGAGSEVQHGKLNKRVGIHPRGGFDPLSEDIVWTEWQGEDKGWIRVSCAAEASGNRLTIFVEADDPESGGQDQLYIDNVWLEEEGAPTPTATPTRTSIPTATPTPTSTPPIAVLRSIGVGSQPRGIGVLPSMNRFFVVNSGEDTVSSLEGFLDWRHTKLQSGGQHPIGVAVDEARCRMYIVNAMDSSVTAFDACTGRHLATIPLGADQAPDGAAVLTTMNMIYVANAATDSVSVIDGDTLTVARTIAVEPVPGHVAANPHTNKVYVTNRGYFAESTGSVTVIDGSTQTVLKTIGLSYTDPVPAPGPYGVTVNPVTNLVYVATSSGKLLIIDGDDDTVVRAVSPPVATGLGAVAVNPGTNNVFVSTATGNTVLVYDADEGHWRYTLFVGAGLFRSIAVNPLTDHVLVSNTDDDTVSVIRDFGAYQPFKLWLPSIRR